MHKYSDEEYEAKAEEIIDKAADEYYELKISGKDENEYVNKQSFIFEKLNSYAEHFARKNAGYKNLSYDDLLSLAYKTIAERLNKWTPNEHGFMKSYRGMLYRRINDAIKENIDPYEKQAFENKKRKLRKHPELSEEEKSNVMSEVKIDYSYNNSDEDNEVRQISSGEDIEERIIKDEIFKLRLEVFTEVALTRKKYYLDKKTKCYEVLLYTEFVTAGIQGGKYKYLFNEKENAIMKIVDHNFISFYMDGKNDTVDDIANGSLKKLKCFNPKAKEDQPCGYPLVRKYVYVDYSKILKGRKISPSAICQHEGRLTDILKIAEKIKLNEC